MRYMGGPLLESHLHGAASQNACAGRRSLALLTGVCLVFALGSALYTRDWEVLRSVNQDPGITLALQGKQSGIARSASQMARARQFMEPAKAWHSVAQQRMQPLAARVPHEDNIVASAVKAASPSSAFSNRRQALAGLASFFMGVAAPSSAILPQGKSGEILGEIKSSGLIFKDTIDVQRITDPKVSGVTIYVTDFKKSTVDKLKSKDGLFEADPGAAGLACAVDGKVLASPDISKDKGGEEVFSENKALLGKTLRVRRVFDEGSNALVYVIYTERLNKDADPNGSRFKSQACAIHLDGFKEST